MNVTKNLARKYSLSFEIPRIQKEREKEMLVNVLIILDDIIDGLLDSIHNQILYFDKASITWNRATNCDREFNATISIAIGIETTKEREREREREREIALEVKDTKYVINSPWHTSMCIRGNFSTRSTGGPSSTQFTENTPLIQMLLIRL
jgi:hypothetical protein